MQFLFISEIKSTLINPITVNEDFDSEQIEDTAITFFSSGFEKINPRF